MTPWGDRFVNQVVIADCLDAMKDMPDQCVQTCITSPPYWGLRDYSQEGQLGLEETPDLYVGKMVQVFREVRRVLRDDGTLWLNLGDSYCNSSQSGGGDPTIGVRNLGGTRQPQMIVPVGLKPKDLVGIPWRVAFALQADGWYLRSDIIWYKPNPMPESVTDRPTKAHEYVFLLSKSQKYFYDADAVREGGADTEYTRERYKYKPSQAKKHSQNQDTNIGDTDFAQYFTQDGKRNKRSVWEIPTQPYPRAHFATFPIKLVEPCILAGTSEKGCCPECGKAWVRVVEKTKPPDSAFNKARYSADENVKMSPLHRSGKASGQKMQNWLDANPPKTTGWRPQCSHDREPVGCIVLDPFGGSGTVAQRAKELGRRYVHIDLGYEELALERLCQRELSLHGG